ncbi:hypothetical protein [Clostridium saccharoperbutylacetonicum]|uniref:hypothetical protein n=1 Tax=Clostridium saccharoperbutylacetonicum TaxID=36745 RepID=UPI0009838D5D|nr:hypothetical protein [Clostridium saccharoperbutylacetonicum]AQR98146.1 hypothetical protein CLSAP_54970 [Clostridium saccharoperbutylacetonicum]NSB34039.1 hypothetical protein [Clostridium saccharoperbutylacetonicum]
MMKKKIKQKLALFLVAFSVLTTVNITPAHAIGGFVDHDGESIWAWWEEPSVADIAKEIPKRLLRDGESVEVGYFNRKIRGEKAWKEDGGWVIERDRGGENSHGGSYWKLKDKKGGRVATLDEDGKILRK